ncbi:MAG: STAS domain-containing protein [Micromonosporaceae bacterium]
MELSLQTRTVADQVVLEVGGEIDVYTAPKLKERLLELIADGSHQILVDLEAVEFLDSTGLGVLVGGFKRLQDKSGYLALVCTQERILKIFRITGLAGFFDIYPSVEEASAAIAEADSGGEVTEDPDTTETSAPDAPGS